VKECYEEPFLEMIQFDTEDVMTDSSGSFGEEELNPGED